MSGEGMSLSMKGRSGVGGEGMSSFMKVRSGVGGEGMSSSVKGRLASFPGLHAQLLSLAVRKAGEGLDGFIT